MKLESAIFIQNPNSGKRKGVKLSRWVDAFSKEYAVVCELWKTTCAEDFNVFVKKAIERNPSIIIACGGDGTLNLISKSMIGSNIPMGIVPLGSGNGLARHLKINLNTKLALKQLISSSSNRIDTGIVNSKHFLNVAGIGYDALISKNFAEINKRGVKGYVREVVKEASLKLYDFEIKCAEGEWKGKSPMVCFTNGSQWGGNMKVNKHADMQDGILECNIFTSKSWIAMGYSLLHPNINNVGRTLLKSKRFNIKTNCPYFHYDGEPQMVENEEILVEVNPAALLIRF